MQGYVSIDMSVKGDGGHSSMPPVRQPTVRPALQDTCHHIVGPGSAGISLHPGISITSLDLMDAFIGIRLRQATNSMTSSLPLFGCSRYLPAVTQLTAVFQSSSMCRWWSS